MFMHRLKPGSGTPLRGIALLDYHLVELHLTKGPSRAIMNFVLRFYDPVNPMGSCRAWSVYLTTRLLGRLSPLSG